MHLWKWMVCRGPALVTVYRAMSKLSRLPLQKSSRYSCSEENCMECNGPDGASDGTFTDSSNWPRMLNRHLPQSIKIICYNPVSQSRQWSEGSSKPCTRDWDTFHILTQRTAENEPRKAENSAMFKPNFGERC